MDLPRAQEGGLIGGCFAIFVPDPEEDVAEMEKAGFDPSEKKKYPSPPLELSYAYNHAVDQLLAVYGSSAIPMAKSRSSARPTTFATTWARTSFRSKFTWRAPTQSTTTSIRSNGSIWPGCVHWGSSGRDPTISAPGVPIKRSGSPDIGPGLTDMGKALVRDCNELGIMIDVSHLNEAGFWDVAKTSTKPMVATHSNANALAPAVRNLTDKQLDAVRDSDGSGRDQLPLRVLAKRWLFQSGGNLVLPDRRSPDLYRRSHRNRRVALGSDFDGAAMPGDLKDAAGMPRLIEELRRAVSMMTRSARSATRTGCAFSTQPGCNKSGVRSPESGEEVGAPESGPRTLFTSHAN